MLLFFLTFTRCLQVNGAIDRRLIPRYNLTFCAEDRHLSLIRRYCQSLDVVVNSPNDHSPLFLQSSYSVTLSEISPIGSYVVGVAASDQDIGITGRLKYE